MMHLSFTNIHYNTLTIILGGALLCLAIIGGAKAPPAPSVPTPLRNLISCEDYLLHVQTKDSKITLITKLFHNALVSQSGCVPLCLERKGLRNVAYMTCTHWNE